MAIKNRARKTGSTNGQQGSSSSSSSGATSVQAPPLTPFRPIELVTQLLTNHAHIWKLAGLLFLFEILLNIVIIKKIPCMIDLPSPGLLYRNAACFYQRQKPSHFRHPELLTRPLINPE